MFNNMKLGTKLIGGFVAISLVFAVIGVYSVMQMNQLNNKDTELYELGAQPLAKVGALAADYQRTRVNNRDMINAKTQDIREDRAAALSDRLKTIDDEANELEKEIKAPELKRTFDDFKTAKTAYFSDLQQMQALARANKRAEIDSLMNGRALQNVNAAQKALDSLVDQLTKNAKSISDDNTASATHVAWTVGTGILIGTLLAIGFGTMLSLSITRPMKKMTEVAEQIGLGDVNQTIEHKSGDEIGQLAESFRVMSEMIKARVAAVEKIATGDLNAEIKVLSDRDTLAKGLIQVVGSLRELMTEVARLTQASHQGQLSERGKSEQFKGAYAESD